MIAVSRARGTAGEPLHAYLAVLAEAVEALGALAASCCAGAATAPGSRPQLETDAIDLAVAAQHALAALPRLAEDGGHASGADAGLAGLVADHTRLLADLEITLAGALLDAAEAQPQRPQAAPPTSRGLSPGWLMKRLHLPG